MGSGNQQLSRKEQRAAALHEVRALGHKIRSERYRPDVYAVTQRLGLASQAMAQRLLATRRLDERLALLVPPAPPPPSPEEILHNEQEMPPAEPPVEAAHALSGERLARVACHIAAAIECFNHGALLGREELQGIIRSYDQDAMRFGLKFRSAVPVYLLELLRQGQAEPMQLAATAIVVWSEIEHYPLTDDIRQNLMHMHPVRLNTLDNPQENNTQETVDLVRYAMTATKNA